MNDVFLLMVKEIDALRRRVAALEHQEQDRTGQGAGVRRALYQAIPNATYTAVSFDTEDWDTDNCWNYVTPTRVYCNTTGLYVVSACVRWAASTAGVRILRLHHDTTIVRENLQYASGNVLQNLNAILSLNTGDYLELMVYQDSGASLNLEPDSGRLIELAMVRF